LVAVQGGALYAGGFFTAVSGVAVNYIARWDGSTWSALGPGSSNRVEALTLFDEGLGNGSQLYAGGWFTYSGSTSNVLNRIAKWTGAAWAPLDNGLGGADTTTPYVYALGVYSNGLYAGGDFTSTGALSSVHIARWGCTEFQIPPCTAPTITQQPAAQAVCSGGSVDFSVSAGGSQALIYQWRKAGADRQERSRARFTLPAQASTTPLSTASLSATRAERLRARRCP